MKNIITIGLVALLGTNLMAKEADVVKTYVKVSYGKSMTDSGKILGTQEISELIEASNEVKISIGLDARNKKDKPGISNSSAGFYVKKGATTTVGIEFAQKTNGLYETGHGFYWGGGAGFGFASDKGKRFHSSSGVNKVSYITSRKTAPSDGTIVKDTGMFELNAELGYSVEFTEDTMILAGVELGYQAYQFNYRLDNSYGILNCISAGGGTSKALVSLKHTF